MTNVCERCGRSNRAGAMFCIGCAGRLPGFAPSGPSALRGMTPPLASERAAARRSEGDQGALARQSDRSDHPARTVLPPETQSFWMVLGVLAMATTIGFVALFVNVTGTPSLGRGGKSAQPASTAPPTSPDRMAAALPPPQWHGQASGPPAAQVPQVPLSTEASTAYGAGTVLEAPDAGAAMRAAVQDPSAGSHAGQVQAVESFYRALSVADGKAAAAVVIPAKRGAGPFNENNMARFFGSFDRPLLIRSLRAIDDRRVEARYSYRVSRTTCEGTAIVETQRVGQQILIRSIRANC
ncbi:hypothetical protein QTH90_29760 [Variovorax sp. J2P1-59]|uniref:hypothetical protein n=1 Tax=Variovorax flavidus TaxID=3053501 RepID=UPI0025761F4A|nr:hypothetical protein [Variovorax sp. J2P1-59]MDM0078626.1 hypothetical protein [Variovorax sp. J2P1-59]